MSTCTVFPTRFPMSSFCAQPGTNMDTMFSFMSVNWISVESVYKITSYFIESRTHWSTRALSQGSSDDRRRKDALHSKSRYHSMEKHSGRRDRIVTQIMAFQMPCCIIFEQKMFSGFPNVLKRSRSFMWCETVTGNAVFIFITWRRLFPV